jgi:hypothetical protein
VFGPLKKFLVGQRFISDDDAKTAVLSAVYGDYLSSGM